MIAAPCAKVYSVDHCFDLLRLILNALLLIKANNKQYNKTTTKCGHRKSTTSLIRSYSESSLSDVDDLEFYPRVLSRILQEEL